MDIRPWKGEMRGREKRVRGTEKEEGKEEHLLEGGEVKRCN